MEGTATVAAGGRRAALAGVPWPPAGPRLGALRPSAPLACAACCGRCESPS